MKGEKKSCWNLPQILICWNIRTVPTSATKRVEAPLNYRYLIRLVEGKWMISSDFGIAIQGTGI